MAGSVHVALWDNGAMPSALKCHETDAIFYNNCTVGGTCCRIEGVRLVRAKQK